MRTATGSASGARCGCDLIRPFRCGLRRPGRDRCDGRTHGSRGGAAGRGRAHRAGRPGVPSVGRDGREAWDMVFPPRLPSRCHSTPFHGLPGRPARGDSVSAHHGRNRRQVAYKRILLGTDGTDRAAHAGRVAAALATAGKAELIVGHVWEKPEGAEERLAVAVDAAKAAGVKKVTRSCAVPVHRPRSSPEIAEFRDVGLVVVSGGAASPGLGVVADRLSHHSPRDLLIVSYRPTPAEGPVYRRLLIATDGSPTADRAARKGYDLADALGRPGHDRVRRPPRHRQAHHRRHAGDVRARGRRDDHRRPAGRPGRRISSRPPGTPTPTSSSSATRG